MRPEEIIIAPILSEKSNLQREGEVKKYTFKVNLAANKIEIMDAVKALFNVDPVSCNVAVFAGKPKNSRSKRGMVEGCRSDWKKAVVTVKKGQKIDALEVI